VVVLAMAAAVGVVFAMFASPRGCGVYTVEAGSGAIRCVEVEPKVGTTQCRRAAAKVLTRDEARRIGANGGLGRG
jgi:hypothetical protein